MAGVAALRDFRPVSYCDCDHGDNTLGQTERLGYLLGVVCGCAEVAGPETFEFGECAELLGKYRRVYDSPGETLEIVEAGFGVIDSAPGIEAVEVKAECQHSFSATYGRLVEVSRREIGYSGRIASDDYTVGLHIPGVGCVCGCGKKGVDKLGRNFFCLVVGPDGISVFEVILVHNLIKVN